MQREEAVSEKRVEPYPDGVQGRQELVLRTYEYRHPFNYSNVTVQRAYTGGEPHGMELFPIAEVTPPKTTCHKPAEGIVIVEEEPIVRVVVIGSACTPPGYVTLEAEPCQDFRRSDELAEVMPVRMRVDNLWGMHLRVDQWHASEGGRPLPDSAPERVKEKFKGLRCTANELPLAGMSCAVFEIPQSCRVRVSGGSMVPGWTGDNFADDAHYSFRIIRTTVIASDSRR